MDLKCPQLACRNSETNGGCSQNGLFAETSWHCVVILRFKIVWLVFVTTLWRCLNTTWGLVCVPCMCVCLCLCVLLAVHSSDSLAAFWPLLYRLFFFPSSPVASMCSCFDVSGDTERRICFPSPHVNTRKDPNDVKARRGKKIRRDVCRCFLCVINLENPLRTFVKVRLSSCFDRLQVIKWPNDWLV